MRVQRVILLAGLLVCCWGTAVAADPPASAVSLDSGFRFLYGLDFEHAHQAFAAWQRQYPENPLGPVCEAAGLLFSEFNRLGVLEAQFYLDDKSFQARQQFTPDPALRSRFEAALDQAEKWAQARLAKDSKNRDALFAMTMASGLRADYAGLIEKRNLASLHFTKQATAWAQQLLVVDPGCYDAHLATGVSQYIVGSMSAPVRWLVRLGGVSGDKEAGIRELQVTADRGQYLAPFARILLAIAAVREKNMARARELLVTLRNDFPQNPLFAREITRLDAQR
jgi:hypothetical protein